MELVYFCATLSTTPSLFPKMGTPLPLLQTSSSLFFTLYIFISSFLSLFSESMSTFSTLSPPSSQLPDGFFYSLDPARKKIFLQLELSMISASLAFLRLSDFLLLPLNCTESRLGSW